MNKQNKFYKFLRIVFLTLAIISMVFGLCKKVGLCASDSTFIETSSNVPGYWHLGNDFCIGVPWYIDPTVFEDIIANDYQLSFWLTADMDACLGFYVNDWASDASWVRVGAIPAYSGGYTWTYQASSGLVNYSTTRYSNPPTTYFYKIFPDGTWSYDSYSQSGYGGFNLSLAFSNYDTSGPYHLKINQFIEYYPIWLNSSVSDSVLSSFDDTPLLVPYTGGSSDGHSKGGIIAEMTENDEITSEELPQVDVSAPSDPSSNSGWFQKILNAIGKVNNSIQSGVLTISGYIQGIKDYISEPFDQEGFEDEFYSIPIINDFTSLGDLINDSGVFDWSDVTPAQRVAFTFDFGGSVLPHTSNEINFDWYTGTVKTTILALMSTFLVLGLLVTIINQIPNIIAGKSGDKGGGSDS